MTVLLLHDRPLAIAPLHSALPLSDGVVHYLRDITEALRATGERVVSIALDADCTPAGSVEEGWFTRPMNGVRPRPDREEALVQLIDEQKPSAVHFHGLAYVCRPKFISRLAARFPALATLHDVGNFCPKGTRLTRTGSVCAVRRGAVCLATGCHRPWATEKPAGKLVNLALAGARNRALASAQRVLCPSSYIANLAKMHGMPDDRLHVLPNYSRYPAAHGPRPGTGRILYVGRLEAEKGFDILIDALRSLADRAWHLNVVGEGPLAAEATGRLGHDRITLMGPVESGDLAPIYAAADLVALPYRMPEAFGMVGVEALSQGVPVVGFPAGGADDWMRPELGAIPAAGDDAPALAAALARALDTPTTVPETGAFGLDGHIAGLRRHYDAVSKRHD